MTPKPRILIPLPDHDFDPTESATPWTVCTERGWEVVFATEQGQVAAADHRLLLGILRGPLGAGPKGLEAYRAMTQSDAYQHPICYADIDVSSFDAVSLTGGHAPGMKQYLESKVLQSKMVEFWKQGKVVGAICHGVLVLARAIDPGTGKSILYGSKVTALTKDLEMTGYGLTFWLLGRRYRTYDCYVADEVRQVLKAPKDFKSSPAMLIPYVVEDGRLVSARWPLDAMAYSRRLASVAERVVERSVTGG
jgi:putative intracellular protease/amidase